MGFEYPTLGYHVRMRTTLRVRKPCQLPHLLATGVFALSKATQA
jgi:hypothetical protein